MDPQQRAIAAEFDKYHNDYDSAVNKAIAFSGKTVDAFTRAKAEDLQRQIARHFPEPSQLSILDVGCGVGNYHPLIADGVGSLHGVDISTACIERARERNPTVGYDVYDGSRLPYEDDRFDVAFCVCVMHHVPPPQWPAFAAELRRVLRLGGLVTVYEHSAWHPLTRRVVSNCEFDRDAVLIPMQRMRQLLGEAGFETVTCQSILSLPPGGTIARRMNEALSSLPFGTQYRATGLKK